jgi:DNA mismatch repair protein MutL
LGRIRVLSDDLISLISAGEVIENPSSIVKELIENSLDAGADYIDVEITDGGIDKIVVSDNGCGILSTDCLICINRYSTSKIASRNDIDAISTYGFRGEALASIVAVANLKIITRSEEEETGTILISRIGESPKLTETSRNPGTTVEVTDLFEKVPARKKHLSDTKVESQQVFDILMRHAIVRPDIGFRLIRDGNIVFEVPPNQKSRDRVLDLWGSDVAKSLVEIGYRQADIKIDGFIVLPPLSRGNRSRELFSVIKRPIQEPKFCQAVEAAYSTLLMKGRFPICAINISIDYSQVDANVHPTKREVRIKDIESVVSAINQAVKKALEKEPLPEVSSSLEEYIDEPHVEKESLTSEIEIHRKPAPSVLIEDGRLESFDYGSEAEMDVEVLGGTFRIIGQIENLYILLDIEDGLLIVDQHAAHERVLYERLRKEIAEKKVPIQELLEPIVLRLDPRDGERILELSGFLETIGYSISSFGGKEILVSTIPEILGKRASMDELLSLVDRILDLGQKHAKEQLMDELIKLTACHSAYRAGRSLSINEIRELLTDLAKTESRYNCCHGRPSIIKISRNELDERFGRTGAEALARFKARHRL